MMEASRPKSHTGDYNIKRRFGKGFRNSKKSIMIFSNHKKDDVNDRNYEDNISSTPHRSCSLNALHTGQVLLQPRMAQLETLEAKMARIENSLSTTPRKKKISSSNSSITSALATVSNSSLLINNSVECHQSPLTECKSNSLRSISTFPKISDSGQNMLIYKTSRDIAREMEALKNALRDKENVIDNLKGQLNTSLNFSRLSTTYLQSRHRGDNAYCDKQAAEDRLQRLKHEMDNKSLLIKNIKLELERLDITDNIDVRIKQAELEYQLGREELNLLSILEEIQSLKIVLEERDSDNQQSENTLFSFIQNKSAVTLHATEIVYDAKSPRFGANVTDDGSAVCVDWAAEDSGLIKGDILLEINGKIMLGIKNRDDIVRLLSVSPNPAQMVVMRQHKNDATVSTLQQELKAYREKAGEAERIRDSFRSDNVRLTHRISYLEEQVAELLSSFSTKGTTSELGTNVKYLSSSSLTPPLDDSLSVNSIGCIGGNINNSQQLESKVQIFQKGSKVTLINDAIIPSKNSLKIRDVLPTVQNRVRSKHLACKSMDTLTSKEVEHCNHHPYSDSPNSVSGGSHVLQQSTPESCKKDDHHATYSPSSVERLPCISLYTSSQVSSNSRNKENYYNLVNERRLRYLRETQGGLLSYNGERTLKHFKDDRSCKSVDFDSEPNYYGINRSNVNGRLKMYDSETSSDYSKTIKYSRPIPPQKPLRLSLHKGCSLQSVKIIDKSSSDLNLCKKNLGTKRSQKFETASNDLGVTIDKCNEKWC